MIDADRSAQIDSAIENLREQMRITPEEVVHWREQVAAGMHGDAPGAALHLVWVTSDDMYCAAGCDGQEPHVHGSSGRYVQPPAKLTEDSENAE